MDNKTRRLWHEGIVAFLLILVGFLILIINEVI